MNSIADIIQIPFGYVLEFLYNFTTNYGLALILFSLVVKLVLLPISAKSKKSMMKMSRLQPQLKQLELACGDDKQKYQQEVTALYKAENVSMTGGCLWSFIPLLILLPLYTVIREPLDYLLHLSAETVEQLKQAFIAAGGEENNAYWQYVVSSNLDTYGAGIVDGIKSLNFTFLGVNLGQKPSIAFWKDLSWSSIGGTLIPVLSGACNYLSVFISQKMNNTVITDDKGERDEKAAATAQTGKVMTYLMPLISVYFGFIMPLGISIYWIAQSLFGILQDFFLTKHYRKVYDAEDAVKREKAAQLAAEEAEKERIRAAKRAANPDGIVENTSKKKQQLREKQAQEAAAKNYEEKKRAAMGIVEENEEKPLSGDASRPYSRGRAYDPDRYAKGDK